MMDLPAWERIAEDLDAEGAYLLRRCLPAEGKDPHDSEARTALLAAYARQAGAALPSSAGRSKPRDALWLSCNVSYN